MIARGAWAGPGAADVKSLFEHIFMWVNKRSALIFPAGQVEKVESRSNEVLLFTSAPAAP